MEQSVSIYRSFGERRNFHMKNVLKLILIIAVISALCLSAFAASATERTLDVAGAEGVAAATTDAEAAINVEVTAPTSTATVANAIATVANFDINVTKGTEVLHSGITVNVTVDGLADYIGKYLNVLEGSKLLSSTKITDASQVVAISSFSTYTVVVTDQPMQSAVAPQTSQTMMPFVLLSVMMIALCGVVVAAKRRAE